VGVQKQQRSGVPPESGPTMTRGVGDAQNGGTAAPRGRIAGSKSGHACLKKNFELCVYVLIQSSQYVRKDI